MEAIALFKLIMILAITFLAWQAGLILLCVFFWLLSIVVRGFRRETWLSESRRSLCRH